MRLFILSSLATAVSLVAALPSPLTSTSPLTNGTASAQSPSPQTTTTTTGSVPALQPYSSKKMLCLVNKARAANGVSPLGLDDRLDTAAHDHSTYQGQMDKLSHEGANNTSPSDRVSKAGFKWSYVEENVAFGPNTEADTFKLWVNSPPHYANLLSPKVTMFGSGRCQSKDGKPYYTQLFAKPLDGGPATNVPNCNDVTLDMKLPPKPDAATTPAPGSSSISSPPGTPAKPSATGQDSLQAIGDKDPLVGSVNVPKNGTTTPPAPNSPDKDDFTWSFGGGNFTVSGAPDEVVLKLYAVLKRYEMESA